MDKLDHVLDLAQRADPYLAVGPSLKALPNIEL